MPRPPIPLPIGHTPQTLYALLEAHRWQVRPAAKVLGIAYRALEALRQQHGLYARNTVPTHTAFPEFLSASPSTEATPEGTPHLATDPNSPPALLSVPEWGRRQQRKSDAVRALRQAERICPLYVLSVEGCPFYYTTLEARVLPTGTHHPPTPLTGYQALHLLERQHGLLRPLMTRLALNPVGTYPTLLRDADVVTLLEAAAQQGLLRPPTPPAQAAHPAPAPDSPPDPGALPARVPAPPPLPPLVESPARSETGYVPQAGWITLPRFEALRDPEGVRVYDRGAHGEHWYAPTLTVLVYDPAVLASLFPVLHDRPSPLRPITVLECPSAPPLSAQPPEPPEDPPLPPAVPVSPGPRTPAPQSSQASPEPGEGEDPPSPDPEALEGAPVGSAPAEERGYSRVPDRRLKQLEQALLEQAALQAKMAQLERDHACLLEDQLALAHPLSRERRLDHVRVRLRERFALEWTQDQIEAFDRQTRSLETVGVTARGDAFKRVRLGDREIYALVVRDQHGAECVGTVYDREMYERNQARLQKRALARKKA